MLNNRQRIDIPIPMHVGQVVLNQLFSSVEYVVIDVMGLRAWKSSAEFNYNINSSSFHVDQPISRPTERYLNGGLPSYGIWRTRLSRFKESALSPEEAETRHAGVGLVAFVINITNYTNLYRQSLGSSLFESWRKRPHLDYMADIPASCSGNNSTAVGSFQGSSAVPRR